MYERVDTEHDNEPVFRLIYSSHSRIPAADATSELGEIFTTARRSNRALGVTGALREAQLSLLDRAKDGKLPAEIAHPFFWAPFAVIGDGGEGAARSTVSSR